MNHDEILQAAKEAGCNVKTDGFITYRDEPVGNMLERFAAIVEKRTIERCAVVCEMLRDLQIYADKQEAQNDCAAAIRALGDADEN